MKKTFRFVGMLLVAIMFAGGFASCSDDDDDVSDARHDYQLIGKWTNETTDEDGTYTDTYEFKKDGTYKENATFNDGSGTDKYEEEGVWYTQDGEIYFTITKSSDADSVGERYNYSYSISNNTLLIDDTYYLKK